MFSEDVLVASQKKRRYFFKFRGNGKCRKMVRMANERGAKQAVKKK